MRFINDAQEVPVVTNYDTTTEFSVQIFRGKNWPSRSFVVAMACSIVSHAQKRNRSSQVATEGRIAEIFTTTLKKKKRQMNEGNLDLHKYNAYLWSIMCMFSS